MFIFRKMKNGYFASRKEGLLDIKIAIIMNIILNVRRIMTFGAEHIQVIHVKDQGMWESLVVY